MKTKIFKTFVLALVMCSLTVLGGVLLSACAHQHTWTFELAEEGSHMHYRICSGCGERVLEDCTLEVTEQHEATCDEPSYVIHTCKVCKLSHKHEIDDARGHDYGDPQPLYQDDNPNDDNPGQYLKRHASYCSHDNTHVVEEECSFTKTEVVEPTCSNAGFTKHICETCGGYYTSDEKDALGHQFGQWQYEEKDGHFVHYQICSNEKCDLPNHRFEEVCSDDTTTMNLLSTTDATCTAASTEVYECLKCKRQVSTHNIAALGHAYEKYEYVQQQDGTYKHKKICVRPTGEDTTCGHEELEECTFLIEIKNPTCDDEDGAGYTLHTCKFCTHSYKDDIKEKLEHIWTEYYKNADGLHERKCEQGNHFETHEPNYKEDTTAEDCENAEHTTLTCQFDGCNYTENFDGKPATGHVPSSWTHYETEDGTHMHKKYCTVCEEVLEEAECKFTPTITKATCESRGFTTFTCPDCAHEFVDDWQDQLGHSWAEWLADGDRHYRICQNDPEHIQEHTINKNEKETSPTCTEAGNITITCLHQAEDAQCTITSVTPIDALGHLWNWDTKTNPDLKINEHSGHENAKCGRCGETHTGAHLYTKNNLCDYCGWDGLLYTMNSDGTASLSSDRYVDNVKEIIISDLTPNWNVPETGAGERQMGVGYKIVTIATNSLSQNKNVEKIVFGKNITQVSDSSIFGCKNLKIVVFNEGLQIIRPEAFSGCSQLQTLQVLNADGEIDELKKVPTTITYISSAAFKQTAFEADQENWVDVFYNTAEETQELVGRALILGGQLLSVKLNDGKNIFEVPQEVKLIAENVFRNMKNLNTIILPNSIKKIEKDAFYGCENLEHAVFNGNVNEWLAISFGNDYSSPMHYAKSFTVKDVSEELVIGDNVSTIPAGCFYADEIKSVVIGENVVSIGAGAFENCKNLASVIIKSKKIKYIGENAFKGTAFYDNPESWDASGALYIDGYLIEVKKEAQGQSAEGEDKKVFTVKEGTTLISCGAFRDCSLLEHIFVSKTVERIGANAFVGCTSLKTLTIEDTEHDWVVWTEVIGRGCDVSNPSSNASHAPSFYVGEWYWNGLKKK